VVSAKEAKRREKLRRKMKEASSIYKKLRKGAPKLSHWNHDGEEGFRSWREVWQTVVSMVMRGVWSLKTVAGFFTKVVFASA